MLIVDQEEYRKWIAKEQGKVHARFAQKKLVGKCPRIEKERDFPLYRGACSKVASWSPKPTVAGSIPVTPAIII